MKRLFTILIVLSLVGATFAQEVEKQNLDRNGNPSFVKFNTKAKNTVSKDEAKTILSSLLKMTKNEEFKQLKSETDKIGYTHEKFQQYYKGIKVENGVYIVHSKNNAIESMNGEFKNIEEIDITPLIPLEKATELAKSFINAEQYLEDNPMEFAPELVIVEHTQGKHPEDVQELVLAYKIDVYATKPLSRHFIYVDAQTGEVVHTNALIKNVTATGNAATRYSGTKSISTDSYNSSYRLRDYTRGNGIITYNCKRSTSYTSAVDFTDYDNNWTAAEYNNSAKDNGALDAHWAAMVTYDYFSQIHGRSSFDGNGALIKTYVHYDSNYDNAFWNGSVFTFGDGSSFDILTSLDVFGHEFGHAVCSNTCNLTYSGESGALNEAFSDIWGCAIEYHYAPEKDTWLMGEDLGTALRSISNPKSKNLPDTYKGTYWVTSSSDNYGVHTNNGPFCYWFYLISEGGSGTNDNGKTYSVTAIGIEKAEKIAYRIESVYMTSSSNYANARTYAIQAAKDLYGAGSQEEISVTNAMYAIGVGAAYEGTTDTQAPSAPTSLVSANITQTTFTLSWTASTDNVGVTGYDIYQNGTLKGSSTTTSYNVTGLTAATTYAFTVKAKDAAGNVSAASTSKSVTTLTSTDTSAPTAPTNLAASSVTQTTLSLGWTASTDNVGVTGYDIYRNGSLLASTTSTSYSVTGLTASTTYTFNVKAKDAAGNVSAASSTISVTTSSSTADTQAPTAPTNLTSSSITESSVVLSWTASTDNVGVTGYDIYRNGSLLASTTSTSYSVTGLSASTTYTFYVKAKDAAGNVSSASSTLSVTTDEEVVEEYCSSSGSIADYFWINQVALNEIYNFSGYNYGYGDFTNQIASITPGNTEILYIQSGYSVYIYTVYWSIWIDYNANGVFETSERILTGSTAQTGLVYGYFTVPTNAVLGNTRMRISMKYGGLATSCENFAYGEVEDYTVNITNSAYTINSLTSGGEQLDFVDENEVRIFPNPAKDKLNIEINTAVASDIQIISATGAVVKTIIADEHVIGIDVSDLTPGMYFIQYNNGLENKTFKFIKE